LPVSACKVVVGGETPPLPEPGPGLFAAPGLFPDPGELDLEPLIETHASDATTRPISTKNENARSGLRQTTKPARHSVAMQGKRNMPPTKYSPNPRIDLL
jgi:hypothetical protein